MGIINSWIAWGELRFGSDAGFSAAARGHVDAGWNRDLKFLKKYEIYYLMKMWNFWEVFWNFWREIWNFWIFF